MVFSPPMSERPTQETIDAFEGLVFKTAQMFHAQVGLELDDMRQELRLTILKARRAFHTGRSRLSERSFVYGCVANRVKDMKRDAARRRNGRLVVIHVEEEALGWFEFTYRQVTHDEVFGAVDDGAFVLPATITEHERTILVMLVTGYARTEIALSLDVSGDDVGAAMKSIRTKMADWRPTRQPSPAPAPERERIAA